MKLVEIAQKINEHLKRFEGDANINPLDKKYGTHPYYHAGAVVAGSRIHIRYISYQGTSSLKKAEAQAYLDWLNAGNVGKHYRMQP